jgi:iron(III) transport system permease protein
MFLRVDVYPAVVLAPLGGIDYAPGEALALALPLIPIALLLPAAERRLSGRRSFAVRGLRGGASAPLPLGRWRAAAAAACWLVAALSIAPIALLALRAQRGGGFAGVPDWIGTSLGNSLGNSLLAATGIVVTGLVVGHGVARRRAGAAVLAALTVLAFLTPAVLLGIGLMALWNRPATAFVYGGIGMIVVAYMGRYAVVGLRTLTTISAQSSPHLEESAAATGAGYLRRLVRIVAPPHWRGMWAAWLLALVFCLRDLETAVLFTPRAASRSRSGSSPWRPTGRRRSWPHWRSCRQRSLPQPWPWAGCRCDADRRHETGHRAPGRHPAVREQPGPGGSFVIGPTG